MDKKHTLRLYVHTLYGDNLSIFEPDEKKGFIVTVPGLPGVVTWGRNIAHAKKMAQETIELCIECKAQEVTRHAKRRLPHRYVLPNRGEQAGLPQKTRELVAA